VVYGGGLENRLVMSLVGSNPTTSARKFLLRRAYPSFLVAKVQKIVYIIPMHQPYPNQQPYPEDPNYQNNWTPEQEQYYQNQYQQPPQEYAQYYPEPPKKKGKTILGILAILLAVLVLVGVGIGAYWFTSQNFTPASSSSSSSSKLSSQASSSKESSSVASSQASSVTTSSTASATSSADTSTADLKQIDTTEYTYFYPKDFTSKNQTYTSQDGKSFITEAEVVTATMNTSQGCQANAQVYVDNATSKKGAVQNLQFNQKTGYNECTFSSTLTANGSNYSMEVRLLYKPGTSKMFAVGIVFANQDYLIALRKSLNNFVVK
jgi:cytoskeletal protein RodZ